MILFAIIFILNWSDTKIILNLTWNEAFFNICHHFLFLFLPCNCLLHHVEDYAMNFGPWLVVRDSSVVRRHYIFLLEPWDVGELCIRKTADLPLRLLVGTFRGYRILFSIRNSYHRVIGFRAIFIDFQI